MTKPKSQKQRQITSANLAYSIGYQLAQILKCKRRLVDIEMKPLGLSRTQWQVLFYMSLLGPCSQKELLNRVDIDAAHLARVLEELEKNNYLVRTPLESDRRALFIDFTDHSRQQILPHIKAVMEKENARLLKGLTIADQKQLHQLLGKMQHNMESTLNDLLMVKTTHDK